MKQWAKKQGLTYKGAWRMWKAANCRFLPSRSHRHHHHQANQGPGSCAPTLRPSFFVGAKTGFGSTMRPHVPVFKIVGRSSSEMPRAALLMA